jgi:hypothetical protein
LEKTVMEKGETDNNLQKDIQTVIFNLIFRFSIEVRRKVGCL